MGVGDRRGGDMHFLDLGFQRDKKYGGLMALILMWNVREIGYLGFERRTIARVCNHYIIITTYNNVLLYNLLRSQKEVGTFRLLISAVSCESKGPFVTLKALRLIWHTCAESSGLIQLC